MSKFKSDIGFETPDDLVQAKNNAYAGIEKRRKRLKTIRQFSNGLATMTEEEAEALNREEITNHLTTYSKLLGQETMFKSQVTGTNRCCEIVVDTDNPEQDAVLSERLTAALNQGAFHHKGKFSRFWGKGAGEIVMAGGAPAVHPPKYGWLPRLELDMFFPKGTDLDSDLIPYAFNPIQMTLVELEELIAAIGDDQGEVLDRQNLEALVEAIKKQIKDQSKNGTFGDEITEGARNDNDSESIATIDCWEFFEVKYTEEGQSYVSKTIFTDGAVIEFPKSRGDEGADSARFISYQDKAYKDAFEWLHMISVDTEIGGVKTTDTLRGVAELMYPSGADMEDLLNLMLEGDKAMAKPNFVAGDDANPESIAKWNITTDTFAPKGIEQLGVDVRTGQMQTPMGLLDRAASSVTGAPVSNNERGGELLRQQQERSEANVDIRANRLSDSYNCLDSILETCVWRLLAGPTKPGTEGYHETLWVRDYLDRYKINYKKLAERKHGRFMWIRVRAARGASNGDRQMQLGTSDWLMDNAGQFAPAMRPMLLKKATTMRTQDPDLAELLVKTPQPIINQQKVIAENEFDTIARRAFIGQSIPVGVDDIHEDHIPIHFLDLQSLMGRDQFKPWDMADTLTFAGMVEHTGEHITIVVGNPQTQFVGQQFAQAFQRILQDAKPIIQRAQQSQEAQQQEQQLTAKEQADIELKTADLQLKAQKMGIDLADLIDLAGIREDRQALSRRQQHHKEIADAQRLELEQEKLKTQEKQQQQAPASK